MSSTVDVIIVGAGFSGLAAAIELRKQGLSVLVLEARVRVGGRCQTGEYEGEAFDVGGHWIGDHQPRVRKLLTDRGFVFKAQFDSGKHIMRLFGKQFQYSGNISSLKDFGTILEEAGKLIERFDADMAQVPLDDPTKCPRAKEWDAMTLAEWQRQNIKSPEALALNNWLLWTIFTITSSETSYLWWLYYLRQGHGYTVLSDIVGGAQQDKVVGGLQPLCDKLVEEIGAQNVLLRTPVKKIVQSATGVECITATGAVHRGKRVIVTAPPSVCADIEFQPPLSPDRQLLHREYKAGNVIKVYVIYDNPCWWRKAGFSGEMLSDEEPVTLYYDATTTTTKFSALIGFIPAHLALKWGSVPIDTLKQAIVAQLVREYGPAAAAPRHIIVRPWLHDDVWCKGAYSGSMPPNLLSRVGHILRTPSGRVHWAGTELALDWCGYFEGAVESGQRAAKEILSLSRAKL